MSLETGIFWGSGALIAGCLFFLYTMHKRAVGHWTNLWRPKG